VNVVVNGEARALPTGATVASVVAELHVGPDARGVAVAVDGEVVRRAEWASLTLADGARVEVLGAIGGGR
jgi:sulfur carrier protein